MRLRGIRVVCGICGQPKVPHGSIAMAMHGSCCDSPCPGYDREPLPGCLWPGEISDTDDAPICNLAAEIIR